MRSGVSRDRLAPSAKGDSGAGPAGVALSAAGAIGPEAGARPAVGRPPVLAVAPAEREADRTARAVMRSQPARAAALPPPPAIEGPEGDEGRPLSDATRAFFEPRLAHDLGHVRGHADGRAASAAPALNASASTRAGASGLTGECAACSVKTLGLQAKLRIGAPGDAYEQEADRVAERVLARPAHPDVRSAPPRIQRYAGQASGQADTAPASVDQPLASPGRPLDPGLRQDMEQRFGHDLLQRQYGNRYVQRVITLARGKADERDIPRGVEAAIERKRGGGQALDHGLRAHMESAFGSDFSGVRVHTDAEAGSLNRAVNAVAFTTGQDIFFSQGSYKPESSAGRELLSHELTHVVQQGGSTVQGKLVLGDPGDRYEQQAAAVAKKVARAPLPPTRKEAGDRNIIRRFKGSADFIKEYDIDGNISSVGFRHAITGSVNNAYILAGSSGDLTINLEGTAVGRTSGFIRGGVVIVEFSLENQRIPYRCTPEGEITIETAAINPGHTTHDSTAIWNPFGSDIGVSIGTSVDGSTSPSFVIEQISFTVGGGGISVEVGGGPVSVGGPTIGGRGSESTSIAIRFNFQVIGKRPARAPAAPSASATATAGATASAGAVITGAAPASVAVPPPHSIYFVSEEQTEGNEGELVRWAASLPGPTKDAIRTGRLTTTVMGYASTTGTDRSNFERYSRQRAEWVGRILAHALGVKVDALLVGWVGSYTAPPADRSHRGGVANPHERRADIIFAETAPTTPVSITAGSSASSSATARSGS